MSELHTETMPVNVLLVENKAVCIDVIMSILAGSSISITVCHNLDEVRRAMEDLRPDVVLLDSDLLSPVKAMLRDVPMVIFTSKQYLDKARQWIASIDKEPLEAAIFNAAGRKNAFERIGQIRERMQAREREMEELLAKAGA